MFIGGQEAEHMEMKGRNFLRDDFQGEKPFSFMISMSKDFTAPALERGL
jgi:hypothetical protein